MTTQVKFLITDYDGIGAGEEQINTLLQEHPDASLVEINQFEGTDKFLMVYEYDDQFMNRCHHTLLAEYTKYLRERVSDEAFRYALPDGLVAKFMEGDAEYA